MIVILIVAALASALLGDYEDSIAIAVIIVLNAALSFGQEYRTERAMVALKQLSAPTVKVRREGHVREVSARELVPGDVVLLEAGNLVPRPTEGSWRKRACGSRSRRSPGSRSRWRRLRRP